MKNIREIAYGRYQLAWCLEHGYGPDDLVSMLEEGYSGERFACFEEFLDNEYKEKGYMYDLLKNEHEYKEYLADRARSGSRKEFSTLAEAGEYARTLGNDETEHVFIAGKHYIAAKKCTAVEDTLWTDMYDALSRFFDLVSDGHLTWDIGDGASVLRDHVLELFMTETGIGIIYGYTEF